MLAFISTVFLMFAEAGSSSGFMKFYNDYLNIPGFEVWKFLNLAIFIGILVYLLKKPLSEKFKAQRDAIRADLIRAEEEKKAALARLTEVEARLAQLESEKASVLEKARAEAEAEKKRLTGQTKADIARMREQAEADIARLANQAMAELRRFSAEQSIKLAEEKLKTRLSPETDAKLVRASVNEIGGLN